jgi:hypothetical protein
MNLLVHTPLRAGQRRLQMLLAALAVVTTAAPCLAQGKLELRALASDQDPKDKPAIDAWQKAFADEKNKDKIDQATQAGKPPTLISPKEDGDKQTDPGRYELIPLTERELSLLGISLGASNKTDVENKRLIDRAREKKELVVIPKKDYVLYSWQGAGPDSVGYAALARPASDDATLTGKEVASATTFLDARNKPSVQIKLTKKGANLFKAFSEQNQKHYLLVRAGEQPMLAAHLAQPITDGELEFKNRLDLSQARNVADTIRAFIPAKREAEEDTGDKDKPKGKDSDKDKPNAGKDSDKDKDKPKDKDSSKEKNADKPKDKDGSKDTNADKPMNKDQ